MYYKVKEKSDLVTPGETKNDLDRFGNDQNPRHENY